MTAPILHGYICRVCGLERIQQPWNADDEFVCANCGAQNQTPLLTVQEHRIVSTGSSWNGPMSAWGRR